MGSLTIHGSPLVPEIIGYSDQFILNAISMVNALAFGFYYKLLHVWLFSISFWVEIILLSPCAWLVK